MNIFEENIKKEELLKKIGDITQLGGIKLFEFIDGVSRGIRAAEFKSPSGLCFTVLIDRGMDISEFYYKQVPICWKSATKETSPLYYDNRKDEWLRSFFGGLLTTCGLTNFGVPCIDNNEELGLHGRISNIGAEQICTNCHWENNDYTMEISGKVREAKVFGDKLELTRKITTFFNTPKMIIEDEVENIGFNKSPLMILYHINIGYPVLDKHSKLLIGKTKITPANEISKQNITRYSEYWDPIHNFSEHLYYHDVEPDNDGNVNVALVNEKFNKNNGIGIAYKFNKENLPYFIQWKQMGEGEYVTGLECGNSYTLGRDKERESNRLKFIEPGEIKKFKLEFSVLRNNDEINDFKKLL